MIDHGTPALPSALSVLLFLSAPSIALAAPQADQRSSFEELWLFLDRDGNGAVSKFEGAEAFLFLAGEADRNGDGALSSAEVQAFLGSAREDESEERIGAFIAFDTDQNQELTPGEFPGMLRGNFKAIDADSDGVVILEELLAADKVVPLIDEEPASFSVQGTQADMRGVIGPSTPARVFELLLEHPEVDTIVLRDVPGSMDDDSNLRAALMVWRAGLATHVPSDGEVASGGTDFFLAGKRRSADPGARFGVHSWEGFDQQGVDVPPDDPEHQRYLDFYRAVGIEDSFYWFTLNAAPAEGIHWMTPGELDQYGMLTAGGGMPTRTEDPSFERMLELEGFSTKTVLPLVDGRWPAEASQEATGLETQVRELWDELCYHLPESTRGALSQIRAIRLIGGHDVPPGAVVPVDHPHGEWEVLIAQNALDEDDLLWVLAHEYGHVLSLGDPEVELSEDELHPFPSGPRFGEFFEHYWVDTGLFEMLRKLNPEASMEPQHEERVVSYVRDESGLRPDFVSEFAMVSPEEDFTETFAAYVLRDVSQGSGPIEDGGQDKLGWFASNYPRSAWVPRVPEGPDPVGQIDISTSPDGVVPFPGDADPRIAGVFDRYSKVVAPNGKPIHIFAQSGWQIDQILHARRVLKHLLADIPGSRLGSDKSAIANSMADRRATLVLFDDEPALHRALSGPLGDVELGFQDLRANECPAQGGPDYMVHDTRDAAFEEILHLVHDYGIRPVHPEYDAALHDANLAMQAAGQWDGWPEDEPENHRNEYLAAIYDNYLDLWTVPPTRYEGMPLEPGDIPTGTSHFGTYAHGSRAALREHDPVGFALIEDFLPPHLTYEVVLPEAFSGEFSLRFDPADRYTAKSQHLTRVRAQGSAGVQLRGNDRINHLTAGSGDDLLEGHGADDTLDGGSGADIAVYRGMQAEYEIRVHPDFVEIIDEVPDRDGTDRLHRIESIRFASGDIPVPH